MEKCNEKIFNPKRKKKFDNKSKFGEKKKGLKVEISKIKALQDRYTEIDPAKVEKFADFSLSEKTFKGLKDANFVTPTKIQQESIGLALQGHDILGAAKTGSGKTLAFLLPILEHLYCHRWSTADGLGALIISPTRELAYQIFEVLRKVGKYHDFSAGLVIGGKHVREESERINNTNIVICTPGRLLQHMDQTAYFHADNLQLLVLDEADRILDLGFQQTMNAIIQNLPKERQTLLFSATQTKSVKDLARLSLKNPMYVSVHENAHHSTPTQLDQSYLVCNLEDKISLIWAFVKNHLKMKTLIFLSSCKQVRYIHEVFRRFRPGVPVLALHGAMQQMKRMAVYNIFCRKQNAVLFATDIAARGLDFPMVNWVIQLDCPEDANTYIHRVGRTARYEQDGEALLILLPSEEEAMVSQLESKKIPVNKIKINPKKQRDIQPKMESLLASDVQLKEFAQRAFVSYLKSVFFMRNKNVFNVDKLDTDAFARSLGLAITPRVRLIEKATRDQEEKGRNATKLKSTKVKEDVSSGISSESDSDESGSSGESGSGESKLTLAMEDSISSAAEVSSTALPKKHLVGETTSSDAIFHFELNEDDDDDFLKVKTPSSLKTMDSDAEVDSELVQKHSKKKLKVKTKYAAAKKVLKKNIQVNTKVAFDEEGEEVVDVHKKQQVVDAEESCPGGIDISKAKLRLAEEDKYDRKLYREKIKIKHQEQRIKDKEKRKKAQKGDDEEVGVLVGGATKRAEMIQDSHRSDSDSGSDNDYGSDDLAIPGRSGSESDGGWDSAEYSDFEDGVPPKKKKMIQQQHSDDGDDYSMDTGHNLADDELLALKLLQ